MLKNADFKHSSSLAHGTPPNFALFGVLKGPRGTPYEGGQFKFDICRPANGPPYISINEPTEWGVLAVPAGTRVSPIEAMYALAENFWAPRLAIQHLRR